MSLLASCSVSKLRNCCRIESPSSWGSLTTIHYFRLYTHLCSLSKNLTLFLPQSANFGWNPASSSTLRISVARPVADTHLESWEMSGDLEVLLKSFWFSLSPRLLLVQQPRGNPPPTAAVRPAQDTSASGLGWKYLGISDIHKMCTYIYIHTHTLYIYIYIDYYVYIYIYTYDYLYDYISSYLCVSIYIYTYIWL